jgi:hypothetical protein
MKTTWYTVGLVTCLVIAAYCLIAAVAGAIGAEFASNHLSDDSSPDISAANCKDNDGQAFMSCLYTYQEQSQSSLTEFSSKTADKRAGVQAEGNAAIALSVVGLTAASGAIAFRVARSQRRNAGGPGLMPAAAPAPMPFPPPPYPGHQQAPPPSAPWQ